MPKRGKRRQAFLQHVCVMMMMMMMIMIERKQHDFCMDFLFSEMFFKYFVAVCVMMEIRLRGGYASLLVFPRAGSTI